MRPARIPLGTVASPWGRVPVLHRLALAVEPRDGRTGGPAAGVRVGRETRRSVDAVWRAGGSLPPYPAELLRTGDGGRAALTYDSSLRRPEDPNATMTVRLLLDDPAERWAPRRLDVAVRGPGLVVAADEDSGPFVPGWARRIRPWVLPGPAAVVARGATTVRFRVLRPSGEPVPWVRAELFRGDGVRIGGGHGDRHGEVLIVVPAAGAVPVDEDEVDVALRLHGLPANATPDPADPLALPPEHPLALLRPEAFGLVPVPAGATSPPPEDDLLRGITPPEGYRPATDRVLRLAVGRTRVVPDQTFVPIA